MLRQLAKLRIAFVLRSYKHINVYRSTVTSGSRLVHSIVRQSSRHTSTLHARYKVRSRLKVTRRRDLPTMLTGLRS